MVIKMSKNYFNKSTTKITPKKKKESGNVYESPFYKTTACLLKKSGLVFKFFIS